MWLFSCIRFVSFVLGNTMSQVWPKPTLSLSIFSLFSRGNHYPEAWVYLSYLCFTLLLCMNISINNMYSSLEHFKTCHKWFYARHFILQLAFFQSTFRFWCLYMLIQVALFINFHCSAVLLTGENSTVYLPILFFDKHFGFLLCYYEQFCREFGRLHS